MKKILLGTTALVALTAVSAGAAKAEVSVTAFNYVAMGTQLDTDKNSSTSDGLTAYNNAEIRFYGGADLDNGMKLTAKTEMKMVSGGNGTIDESWFALSDTWGSVKIGSDDTVMDGMHVGAAWVAGGAGLDSNTFSQYSSNYAAGKAFMASSATLMSDPFGIQYTTPDMNGVQVGVSYGTGTANTTSTGFNNEIGLAVAYSGDMSGTSLALSAGVDYVATPNFGTGGDDNAALYVLGADIGMGGFGLNLGYSTADYQSSATARVDEYTITGVASYNMGAHTFGLEAQYAEQNNTVGGSATEATNFAVDYSLDIGGGVYWDVNVSKIDIDVPGGSTTDVDMTIIQSGVGMSF